MSRLSYVASAKLFVFLMLLGFIAYALTKMIEIRAIVPYTASFALNDIAGLLNYLSSVPMELNGFTQYLTSFSIDGITGLLNYLSLVPLDSKTISSYLTTFDINSVIRLLIVWIVFKWADRKLHSLGQTSPSIQESRTGNSTDIYTKLPASKTTVRLRKQSTPRLIIRRNKELMSRITLLESSNTKLREAVDKLQIGHDGHTGQIERLEGRVDMILNVILDVEDLNEWLP
ncbi:MAG: hypothetical protein Q9198_006282 [Flavoplaca austrocitrina]